jgi:hypothetical protein
MKKLIIILLFFSLKGYSQDIRLFEHIWYLHDLVIDGDSNVPPINNEIPFVPAYFDENGIETGMCDEQGGASLEYIGTTAFEIISGGFLAGGCYQNEPYNQMYSSLYIGFWGNLSGDIVFYEIIEDESNRTLIVTGSNGDQAIYGDEVLLSGEEFHITDFSVYPIPVKNNLNIHYRSVDEIQSIRVFNTFGQTVLIINRKQSEIDVTKLPTGMYFVSLQDNAGNISTKKFIKI